MLNKRNILKMVKWLCRKLSYDELLIALSFIIEVIGGLRPDVKLRTSDNQKYPNYRKFRVDPKPPRNAPPDQKDYVLKGHYKKLLKNYLRQKGKELKPIRRRKNSFRPSKHIHCPNCKAPYAYVYANDGRKQNQLRCKICHALFPSHRIRTQSVAKYWCPYCGKALYLWKSGPFCRIYKCGNRRCPRRVQNLQKLTTQEQALCKSGKASQFKLCYQFREYHFHPHQLQRARPESSLKKLSMIRKHLNTVGLVLTYSISCGLSSRMTRFILQQVHGVSISHQCVMNYLQTAAECLYSFNEDHAVNLPDTQAAGDETYVHVGKVWNYTWFALGAISKAILSYNLSDTRDALPALAVIKGALSAVSADSLEFTADGNPAYDSASVFINSQEDTEKPVVIRRKVIGLSNDDPESEAYRPFKQLIERLNRTYKFHTRARCGFKNLNGAIVLTTLFVTYYNFLRPHQSLRNQTPIPVDELKFVSTLQGKWVQLLKMAS